MRAVLDFAARGVLGVREVFGLAEAEVLGWDGEEELFDGVQGAVGEDVDCVDDVVEEGLGRGYVSIG